MEEPPTQEVVEGKEETVKVEVIGEEEKVEVTGEEVKVEANVNVNLNDQHYIFTRSPSSDGGSGSNEEEEEEEGRPPALCPPGEEGWSRDQELSEQVGEEEGCEQNGVEDVDAEGREQNGVEGVEGDEDGGEQELTGEEVDEDHFSEWDNQYKHEMEEMEYELKSTTFKIFVSNLPPGLLSSELQELFEKYGDVSECEVFSNHYAFVIMKSEENGFQAISQLNGVEIKGCKINVKRSVNSDNPKLLRNTEESLEVGTFKIHIGNLQQDTTKEYIQSMLEECGRVVEVGIHPGGRAAFVHMETEEGGMKAIQLINSKDAPKPEKLVASKSLNTKGPTIPSMTLKVKNVSQVMTASELRDLFTPYGLVLRVKILFKIYYGGTRHALVYLEQYGNIRSAIKEVSEKEVNGVKLSVEAYFEKPEPQHKQQEYNNSPAPTPHFSNDSQWPTNDFSYEPPPPQRFLPGPNPNKMKLIPMPSQEEYEPPHPRYIPPPNPNKMRLIPMPSEAELRMCPKVKGRGRFLLHNQGHQRPSMLRPSYMAEANDSGFGNDYSNFTESNNQWGNAYTDFENSGGENPFPQLPNPESFPAGRPSSQIPNLMEIDWSSDPAPHQQEVDFTSDDTFEFESQPQPPPTTNAVPFDYSQIHKKVPYQHQNSNRGRGGGGNRNLMTKTQWNRLHRGNRGGVKAKLKKGGKARHPGLGTALQHKKLADQLGDQADAIIGPTINVGLAGTVTPASSSSIPSLFGATPVPPPVLAPSEATQTVGNTQFAPYYFQQNWNFKNKRGQFSKPTAKQMREAEEEQKRQYAEYLKQKPWLYQAIPGTVKRVEKN